MFNKIMSANTIVYCEHWEQTVRFYRDQLELPVVFSAEWLVEFGITEQARLSVADASRATIQSGHGRGITITMEVEDIELIHGRMEQAGLNPTTIKTHPWNARVFYLYDPEGHRIEIWQAMTRNR